MAWQTPGGAARWDDTEDFLSRSAITPGGRARQQATGEALRTARDVAAPVFGFAGAAPPAPAIRTPTPRTSDYAGVGSTKAGAEAQFYRDETGWNPKTAPARQPDARPAPAGSPEDTSGGWTPNVVRKGNSYSQRPGALQASEGGYDPLKEAAITRTRTAQAAADRAGASGPQVFGAGASGYGIEGSPDDNARMKSRWTMEQRMFENRGSPGAMSKIAQAYAALDRNPSAERIARGNNETDLGRAHVTGGYQMRGQQLQNAGALDRAHVTGGYGLEGERTRGGYSLEGERMRGESAIGAENARGRNKRASDEYLYGPTGALGEQARGAAKNYASEAAARDFTMTPAAQAMKLRQESAKSGMPLSKEQVAYITRLEAQAELDRRTQRHAGGGEVEGYAVGGGIPEGGYGAAPQMPNPMMAKYGQYLSMAKQYGLPPLDLPEFMQHAEAAQMQARAAQAVNSPEVQVGQLLADGGEVLDDFEGYQSGGAIETFKRRYLGIRPKEPTAPAPTQQAALPQPQPQASAQPESRMFGGLQNTINARMRKIDEYAYGGAIPVAGQRVEGVGAAEGGPREDTIPAIIDGERPAALSSGEYVIPAAIVKLKGTDFFDKLIGKKPAAARA